MKCNTLPKRGPRVITENFYAVWSPQVGGDVVYIIGRDAFDKTQCIWLGMKETKLLVRWAKRVEKLTKRKMRVRDA